MCKCEGTTKRERMFFGRIQVTDGNGRSRPRSFFTWPGERIERLASYRSLMHLKNARL
jgi:hypothetical protein